MPFILMVDGAPRPWQPAPPPPRRAEQVSPSQGIPPVGARPAERREAEHPAAGAYRHAVHPAPPQQRQPALLAHQLMSAPVITAREEDTLEQAWRNMGQHGFRHLVVVRGIQLAGILSDRDLLSAPERETRRVRDAMTAQVVTATPDTPIREIARVMLAERISALPLVSPTGELAGILTHSDILRCVMSHAPLDLWI